MSVLDEFKAAREKYEQAKATLAQITGGYVKSYAGSDFGQHRILYVKCRNSQGQEWWRQFEWSKNDNTRDSRMEWMYKAVQEYVHMKKVMELIFEE